jgi:hypothetical protein
MERSSLRDCITAAIRYWEPLRIVYNVVLAAVVGIYFRLAWPNSRLAIHTDTILVLFLMAVLANVAYCAAYVVDVFAQMSGLREQWMSARWILFVIGTAFAAVLTRFFSLGLFGVS